MKTVHLTYNPYLVRTELRLNDQPVTAPNSPFYRFLTDYRLQYWIEPREGWKGLLGELRSACNTEEIKLVFHGTRLDFHDLEELAEQEGPKYFERVELIHENADTAGSISPEAKLEGLRDTFEAIKKGPVPEFHSDEVTKAFSDAMNSDFEIMVIAPMSSGKSTLINAVLGEDILPAANQATTAVITRIRDVDGKAGFTVSADDRYGKTLCKNVPATLAKISELNSATDPKDKEGKRALVREIFIEGDVKSLPARGLHTVFVDTPGGNNSLNEEHRAVMDEAIANEDRSIVLYVFNGTQVSTQDNAQILKKIADAMKRRESGKQTRDRFLFVANKMDEVDPAKESYESMVETIKKSLAEVGITDPNLFLVSAQTARLIRMRAANVTFTENEDDDFEDLCRRMTRSSRPLYEFSTLPEAQKARFRKRVAELRKQNPDAKQIPEIAEIQSGIPAVEAAITEYLEKYAISIKLKTAHDSFGDIVHEKEIIGKAQQRWDESEEVFQKAQAQADELEKKLAGDKSLERTLAAIQKIELDRALYRRELAAFNEMFQDLMRKYQGYAQVSVREAKELRNALAEETKTVQTRLAVLSEWVKEDVVRQCGEAMEEYRKNMDALRQNGLLDIGGIQVDQLAAVKQGSRALSVDINKYRRTFEKKHKVTVEDSGFVGLVKRVFKVGGYHYEERAETKEYVRFESFAMEALGQLQTELEDDTKRMIAVAEEQVEAFKDEAKKQSQQVSDIVRKVAADFKTMTRDRNRLKKQNEKNLTALKFAEEINQKVESILEV